MAYFLSRRALFRLLGLAGFTAGCSNKTEILPGIAEPEPSTPSSKLRFAVCSDGHYGQPGTNYSETHQNIVNWLNAEKESKLLDFVVFNGDMVHDKPAFLPELMEVLKALKMQYYVTRGNHDMFTEALWKQTWGYVPNHVFETDLYGFILGDTSNEKGEYAKPDMIWLKEQLGAFQKKNKVFVFLHIPQGTWTGNTLNASEVMKLLENYPNVAATFHGHQHEKDGVYMSGGKPYIFDGRFGGNWGVSYQGYRIVEIAEDGSVQTYQLNPATGAKVNEAALT